MTPKRTRPREHFSPLTSSHGVGWNGSLTRRTLAMGCVKPANDDAQFWLALRMAQEQA